MCPVSFEVTQLSSFGAVAVNDLMDGIDVSDTDTAPANPGGSNKKITMGALAQFMAQQACGKALVPANNHCAGDGVTDDTAGMQAAVDAVFAGAGLGLGGVYCPDQYLITSSLDCTSAVPSTSAGFGVSLVGADRDASQIIKGFNGVLLKWVGSGGADSGSDNTSFGGLRNITLNGNSHTGALVQVNSANQMFSENVSYINNPDLTLDLNTIEDSYFVGCTSNNCGSTTAPVVSIYGSASGTSNMLWFTQFRVEAFAGTAVAITAGTGNTGGSEGGNNGFFFSQCKFETTTVHGDFFTMDGSAQQVYITGSFFALDAFASGYSTAANCVSISGSNPIGGNQFTLRDCWVHAGTGIMNSVIDVNGASGAMTGPFVVDSLYVDNSPVTSVFIINGCLGFDFSFRGIYAPGTLFTGDGSYFNSSGTGSTTILGGLAVVNGYVGQPFPSMPFLFVFATGIGIAGTTAGTGASIFGIGASGEDITTPGSAAFVVDDNDKSTFKGQAVHNGGTDTSGTAAYSTPTFTSGTAKQLSTTQDVELYVFVKTAVSVTLAIGAASSAADSIVPATTLPVGALPRVRVPKGWYVKLTCATMADLQLSQVTC